MTRPLHRNDVRRLGIGAVTLVVALLIAWIGITVQGGGPLPGKGYTTVQARFEDVGTMKPQQKVTENGVRIGMVTDISYDAGAALVTMRLDGDVPVYRNAQARIGNESALGKKYVDFDPGTAAAGPLGDAPIPTSRTRDAADLNDVLQAFTRPARRGLSTSLTQLGGGFAGHGDDLHTVLGRAPRLLAGADDVVGALAAPRTELDRLLATSDELTSQFAGSENQLASLMDQTSTTLEAVNVDDTRPLSQTIERLPSTLRTAREGLRAVDRPLARTASAMRRLSPAVDDVVRATPDLRGFFRESPPVALTVQRFTSAAGPAVETLVPAAEALRPVLTRRLARALDQIDPFLAGMAPWWPDAGHLLANNNMLSGHFSPTKHYFSAMLAFPGVYNASVKDPLADVDPYPGPGRAFGRSYQ
ncbi:MCE family protein [Nocardioides sp. TRM66260-LWL]|uniref:MlaD family protein n=1 Tax=Nocardioides sp. TRM66260-LWL TaxID=2874478 RepID=UPI001CC7F2F9|nr:MlaD family protein [Nocardioides sp. TRM66260-LWL]MBZ5735310.1 MCE family protein [Nocardioides sp. TRM66260-LWL]